MRGSVLRRLIRGARVNGASKLKPEVMARRATSSLIALALGAITFPAASAAYIDETRPVDVNPSTGAFPAVDSVLLDISDDGRYILFTSPSTELTDDDYPTAPWDIWHVFRRDMDTGEILLVDIEGGWISEAGARTGTMSGDGSRVVYSGGSPGQPGFRVTHLRDLETGEHEVVSVPDNESRWLTPYANEQISANGTKVTFMIAGTGIDPRVDVEDNGAFHVYVRDTEDDTTKLVDCDDGDPCETSPTGATFSHQNISTDGRYVMFERPRSMPEDCIDSAVGVNSCVDVYVRDTELGTTTLVSRADGVAGDEANAIIRRSYLSDDGRHVLFNTAATNLLPGPMDNDSWNYGWDYVRDLDANTTTLVSRADGPAGEVPAIGSTANGISHDGDEVLFSTRADLAGFPVPPPRPGGARPRYFVRHVGDETTEMVSRLDGGFGLPVESQIGAEATLAASADFVAFVSADPRLPGGTKWHVYRRQVTGEPAPPVAGEKVQLQPEDGVVEVRIPGSDFFEELERGTQIPLGSVIDAGDGALEVFSEDPDPEEPLRHMVWSDGEFVTDQESDGEQLSEAILSGPLLDCDKPSPMTPAQLRQQGSHPGDDVLMPGRKVWGHGGKGHKSKGGKSSASVRGTEWLVWDTCDGRTVTYVVEGRVEVRDFERGRTVFVNPGEIYVAPGPPDTAITNGPSGTILNSTPSFWFDAGEVWSDHLCRIDEASWVACSSPWTSPELQPGVHTFSVRASDDAGSTGVEPAIRAFWVDRQADPDPDPPVFEPPTRDLDTRAPRTRITSGPEERLAVKRAAEVRFRFTADEDGSTFQCRLDDSGWRRCSSPKELRLRPGRHRFEVRAIDPTGNVDASPERWSVRVVRR